MKNVTRILTLCLGALAVACGGEFTHEEELDTPGEVHEGIEGGTEQASGLGAVRLMVDGGGWCSGAIIGPRTVITNAHCVDHVGFGNVNVKLRVNYYDNNSWWCLSAATNTNKVCSGSADGRAWVNPDFEGTTGFRTQTERDFAVITLNRDFTYIRSAHQQTIIKSPTKSMIGTFYSMGYGRNSDDDDVTGDPPRQARFSVNTMGTKYFYSLGGRLDGQNGDTGMRNCKGDSGAPQFEKRNSFRYVFGLHARRDPTNGNCGELDTKQYGVIVGAYMNQIESNMGSSCRHYNHSTLGAVADCW